MSTLDKADISIKWMMTNPFDRNYFKKFEKKCIGSYEDLCISYGTSWRKVKNGDFVILVNLQKPETLKLAQVVEEADESALHHKSVRG